MEWDDLEWYGMTVLGYDMGVWYEGTVWGYNKGYDMGVWYGGKVGHHTYCTGCCGGVE